MRGGGILVVLNTGEGGGGGGVEDQRVHGRFGRINQNTSCLHSEAPGSEHSSCLISLLISNVSLLLFN